MNRCFLVNESHFLVHRRQNLLLTIQCREELKAVRRQRQIPSGQRLDQFEPVIQRIAVHEHLLGRKLGITVTREIDAKRLDQIRSLGGVMANQRAEKLFGKTLRHFAPRGIVKDTKETRQAIEKDNILLRKKILLRS